MERATNRPKLRLKFKPASLQTALKVLPAIAFSRNFFKHHFTLPFPIEVLSQTSFETFHYETTPPLHPTGCGFFGFGES